MKPPTSISRVLCCLTATAAVLAAQDDRPGDILVNEFYWHTTGGGANHYEAVELLVVRPRTNLDHLVITDADVWNVAGEGRVELVDPGSGVFRDVKAGTLVVIYDGEGKDDLDASDHVLRIFARSSPHVRLGPTGHAFRLNDKGDNLHVFRGEQQQHFVRYRAREHVELPGGDPGDLPWRGGRDGHIDVGPYRLNTGTRFLGDSWDEANQPDQYASYSLTSLVADNLGWPNGGANTEWIAALRGVPAEQLRAETPGLAYDRSGDRVPTLDQLEIVTAPTCIPLEEFHIQCHRGAGVLLPENTMLAFEHGWIHGATPEADVRTTSDGVIVAFHDGDFARLVAGADPALAKSGVEDLTYADLARLDVGSWMGEDHAGLRIPRIRDLLDVLAQHPERGLYLDIKDTDLSALAALVRSRDVEKQVILASRFHQLHVQWKELLPTSQTLQWIGGGEDSIRHTIDGLRAVGFQALTSLQVHVRHDATQPDPFIPSSVYLAQLAGELRPLGIRFQVLPWRVHEAKVYERLLDLGVASFATDYLDATQTAVREYYRSSPGREPD